MKFSDRIQRNYQVSGVKNWIAIGIAGVLLLSCIVTPISIGMETGDFFGTLLIIAITAGFDAICVLVIRRSIRKIRTGSLEEFRKTLEPFGEPETLMAWADSQSDRGLDGVDLRFDDEYMAVACGRDIRIRRMDQVRYCWDFGVEYKMRQRKVKVLFASGEVLAFGVRNNAQTGAVLREFYDKTAFGKWIAEQT